MPFVIFLLCAVSWLRFGVDLPLLDDIRQYNEGKEGSLKLRYLFTPANDTLSPVGLFLDGAAFRFLDGNTVAYQFLSLVIVIGALLFLQYRLLRKAFKNKAALCCSFAATAFMLQPDSYWGWQNMAFHQAIPVVCLLGILDLVTSQYKKSLLPCLSIFALGLISGFSYTSGAITALVMSFVLLVLSISARDWLKQSLFHGGISLFVSSSIATAAQLWVLIGVQHGTHRADAPMSYPWESDFWFFLLGKIGRALMLDSSYKLSSFIITICFCLFVTVVCTRLLLRVFKREAESVSFESICFISISAVILVYLFVVAAGRTSLRPAFIVDGLDIFAYGFGRFHFFWVTIIFPWVIALTVGRYAERGNSARESGIILSAFVLFALLLIYSPLARQADFFRLTMNERLSGIECLYKGIRAGERFDCPQIHPGVDMLRVYVSSRDKGASFAKYPYMVSVPMGTNHPAPLYRMSESKQFELVNANAEGAGSDGITLRTDNDPMIFITTGKPTSMINCRMLEVNFVAEAQAGTVSQIFFQPSDAAGFSAEHSQSGFIGAEGTVTSFTLRSDTGFADKLRFDPIPGAGSVTIKDLEVRCRR